jgi:hypothetical protein
MGLIGPTCLAGQDPATAVAENQAKNEPSAGSDVVVNGYHDQRGKPCNGTSAIYSTRFPLES